MAARRCLILLLLLPAGAGHAAGTPEQVLERARAQLQSTTRSLSKFACIETVERLYYEAPAAADGSSCAQARSDHAARKLESTDRLRLEVTVSEGREIYSWPGATRFDSRDVNEIIRQGPIGTGSFGTHLIGVFDNPGVEFHFAGEQSVGDRKVLEYGFHVPLAASHYHVKLGGAWQPLAYNGSFWLDPNTLELQRLTVRAEDVPPETTVCALDGELDYHRVHIGDGDALLPSQAQLRITLESERQTNNITTFADCREYQSESALLFGDGTQASSAAKPAPRIYLALPLGLPVTLSLSTPLDSETSAAGDLVWAKVVQAVRRPGSNEILIPAGAAVRGRITRVEHHLLPDPYFLFAMSFNRLETKEGASAFAARSEGNPDLARQLGVSLSGEGGGLGYWDVGTFLFASNKSRYTVPAGYQSKWITLATRGR
jgi:hypothetical protein